MPWFVIPSVIFFEGDIYLHSSRIIFVQLHLLQLHILCFLKGIQFFGIMTLPIIRFNAHWSLLSSQSSGAASAKMGLSPSGSTEMGMAWFGHLFTPKWVDDAQPTAHRPVVSSRTSPTDGPVKVIKKNTGLDMCHQSEKTATSVHEQQTEAVSIMAKTL